MSAPQTTLRLDHVYLPARKPAWLAEWYAEKFGFTAQEGFVISGGVVLVFVEGEPLLADEKPRFGFRCDSRDQVKNLAEEFAVPLSEEALFCSFAAVDPEGYVFEVYFEGTQAP